MYNNPVIWRDRTTQIPFHTREYLLYVCLFSEPDCKHSQIFFSPYWMPAYSNIFNRSPCVLWIRIHNGPLAKKQTQQCHSHSLYWHLAAEDRKMNFQFWFPKCVHCKVHMCKADIHVRFLCKNVNIRTFFSQTVSLKWSACVKLCCTILHCWLWLSELT